MGSIDPSALEVLGKSFSGSILTPKTEGYDEARTLFNAMVDRRPAVIVQPNTTDDVAAAIGFARARGLELSIRTGGHGVTGAALAPDGLTIDTRRMNDVTVDPAKRIARVGGGAQWGAFDAATQAHGLGATGGRVSTTGVAGLTLGGGSGWIERKHGLVIDNLRAVELVTADGEVARASDDENADLFWALRGGGGNFGVVTALEFELRPLGPEVLAAIILYRIEDAEEMAANYRAFIEGGAPREVGGGVAFLTTPPAPFIPEELHGTVVAAVIALWCGPVAEGEAALAPLLSFGTPLFSTTMPVPYAEFQSMIDDPPGFRNYWSAEYLPSLPDEVIATWASYGRRYKPSPSQFIILPWGGAIDEGPDTAFPVREARWVFHPLHLWESADDDDFWISLARDSRAEIGRHAIKTAYLNFESDAPDEKVVTAFGDRYPRLQKIKAQWDPQNVFHYNNNIKPA